MELFMVNEHDHQIWSALAVVFGKCESPLCNWIIWKEDIQVATRLKNTIGALYMFKILNVIGLIEKLYVSYLSKNDEVTTNDELCVCILYI